MKKIVFFLENFFCLELDFCKTFVSKNVMDKIIKIKIGLNPFKKCLFRPKYSKRKVYLFVQGPFKASSIKVKL